MGKPQTNNGVQSSQSKTRDSGKKPTRVTLGLVVLSVVAAISIVAVAAMLILEHDSKPSEPNFDDSYTRLYYNPQVWLPGEDLSSELKTTSVSFQWASNPELCEVAFFALPLETISGEAWLNQVYDAADLQFGAVNKQLSHSSYEGKATTTLEFQYQNGTETTTMFGKAFTNDMGVIIGLATINTVKMPPSLQKDLDSLLSSIDLHAVPEFTENKAAGTDGIEMLPMDVEGKSYSCYVFKEGETKQLDTEITSVLGGVNVWYEVQSGLDAEASDEDIASAILNDQLKQYQEIATDVEMEEPAYSESTRSVLGQITCTDEASQDKYQTVYRFTRLSDTAGVLWAMQINMTQANQEESSLAYVMLTLHGVGLK